MPTVEGAVPLDTSDYPGLYQAADEASLLQQRAYLRVVRARLVLLVLAAVFAAFTLRVGSDGVDVFALGTALAFVVTLILELSVATTRPDKAWYDGRAIAESVKTLTWRYVAGAEPFSLEHEDADEEFLARMKGLQKDLPEAPLLPTTAPAISSTMRSLRQSSLAERQKTYLQGRVIDQQNWYAGKAEFHRRRANVYRAIMLSMEGVGIAGALAKALGAVDFDMAGIVAAVVSAVAAWTATRQHRANVNAYVVASHELGLIRDKLGQCKDEDQWSAAVSSAESAISREHTMWRVHHNES